jgi:hypothetical protein
LNRTADALSCCEEEGAAALSISTPTFALFDQLRVEILEDPEVAAVRA